jgi:hypothetical protein
MCHAVCVHLVPLLCKWHTLYAATRRFGLPGEALLSRGEDEAPGAGLLPQLEVTPGSWAKLAVL